jgi:hypothetical protein
MRKKIWSKEDLVIALFVSKFGIRGLGIDKAYLVREVIKGTTVRSLNLQAANIRAMLGLEGRKLYSSSKLKISVCEEFGLQPYSILRQIVLKMILKSKEGEQLELF